MSPINRYRPGVREVMLFLIGTTLIAVVCTLDSFGFHLRSRGDPGWWEYSQATFWWAITLLFGKQLLDRLRNRDQ